MSASHKLASQGVFGSDMFRGFAGADEHYFIALPVYQFLQAGVFVMTGTGVAAARTVTLASGLVVLWCVAWLARRWFGVAVAVLAVGLLVIWRNDLLGLAGGLSFLSVTRNGRYDMTAVAFVLLTLVGLEGLRGPERRLPAFLTGIAAGLATLTQFFGVFAVPLVIGALVADRGRGAVRSRTARWLAAGWLLPVIPYGVYVLANWTDFKGQSELKSGRTGFGSPSFYLDNLLDEPDRYLRLFDNASAALTGGYDHLDVPLSPVLFGFMAVAALGLLTARLGSGSTDGERRLLLALAVLGLSLALVDGTNAPVYTVVLLPLLCVAIALLFVRAIGWAGRQGPALRAAALVVVVAPLVVIAGEGAAKYRQEYRWSNQIAGYEDTSQQIEALLPDGAPVLGMERWWAGLYRDHEYLAIGALIRQTDASGESWDAEQLRLLLDRYRIEAIIIDGDAHGLLSRLPPSQQREFDALLAETRHAGMVAIHPYGRIDVYLVERAGESGSASTRRIP